MVTSKEGERECIKKKRENEAKEREKNSIGLYTHDVSKLKQHE